MLTHKAHSAHAYGEDAEGGSAALSTMPYPALLCTVLARAHLKLAPPTVGADLSGSPVVVAASRAAATTAPDYPAVTGDEWTSDDEADLSDEERTVFISLRLWDSRAHTGRV